LFITRLAGSIVESRIIAASAQKRSFLNTNLIKNNEFGAGLLEPRNGYFSMRILIKKQLILELASWSPEMVIS
jgi:hypothetical protein